MEFSAKDAAVLMDLLRWRRDVRHFRSDPIPEAVLDRLRLAMDLAPSVGNARPWRVLRVESPPLRQAVRDEFARCNALAAAVYEGERRQEYARLKLAGLEAAPVQLAVFCAGNPAAGHGLGRQTQPQTLEQSVAMAVFCLWLAARAENLGMGMLSILDPARMDRVFAPGPGWHFSAYLCLGWPETADDTPLLHRCGWQENQPTLWEAV